MGFSASGYTVVYKMLKDSNVQLIGKSSILFVIYRVFATAYFIYMRTMESS